jgi:hypothetical protein
VSLAFQLEVGRLGFLSIPTDKILKHWGWANVGTVPLEVRVCGHVLIGTYFRVFFWGGGDDLLLKFVEALWINPVYIVAKFTTSHGFTVTWQYQWRVLFSPRYRDYWLTCYPDLTPEDGGRQFTVAGWLRCTKHETTEQWHLHYVVWISDKQAACSLT